MIRKGDNLLTGGIILMLIFAVMNVFLMENYFMILAFLALLLRDRRISVNHTAIILVLLAVSYILFYGINDGISTTSILRISVFALVYIVGYSLHAGDSISAVQKTITLLACAMALHSLVNMVYNIALFGGNVFYAGATKDFWSGDVAAYTGQASYYFLITGCLGFIVCGKGAGWVRIPLLGVYLLAFVHNMLLGGRSFLVLSLISLSVGIVFLLLRSKNKASIFRALMVVTILFMVVAVAYLQNWFNLQKWFLSSHFYRRFYVMGTFSMESDRDRRVLIYLQNLLKYPIGGNHLRVDMGIGYAHNLWLDLFDDAGLVTLLLLLFYTIMSIWHTIQFVRRCPNENAAVLVLCVTVALLASFFTEPILAACPTVFGMYCFMDGMLSKCLDHSKGRG